MQELYKTYERSLEFVGQEDERGKVLLPIAHSTANAQIEIAIDLDGNFKGARAIEKVQAVTIIPVTEDSGSRSSGIAAHPLFDKLIYIAGDYSAYVSKAKTEGCFQAYLEQLTNWHDAGCHKYVEAVYQYVRKRSLVKDLTNAGVLELDEEGRLSDKVKIAGISQTDAFVRFYIQDSSVEGLGEIWKDTDVYEDYIRYYIGIQQERDLDYITGEYEICSEKQPSKIRNSGDKAKLISANDSSGFTYRGRFANRKEALSIGFVSSQKFHNALKWLIERQGYTRHEMCVVIWNPAGKEVPGLQYEMEELLFDANVFSAVNLSDDYARRVYAALRGRYADIDTENTDIVVLFLDAATPGRLAVVYYEQIRGSEFLKRLSYWYSTCVWNIPNKQGKGTGVRTPDFDEIIQAAYGYEMENKLHVNDKLAKGVIERLMPCLLEQKAVPHDLVRAATANASNPLAFSARNYQKIMTIACALIYKSYQDDKRKGSISMSLDRTRKERDYLFGRLLAVAHKVEYDTFSESERGKRESNANRFMSKMVKSPARTWGGISLKLRPYWNKLHPGVRIKYEKELQEIYDLFKPEDMTSDRRLGEEYLLGYSCELSDLWRGSKETDNNESGGNEDE